MTECRHLDGASKQREVVNELLGLYKEFGERDYIGDNVSQVQHALQAADGAAYEGYPDEIILGAFFHDVGHLLAERDNLDRMITGEIKLGAKKHAERGQEYLENLGIPAPISQLVGMHVEAKRYLVATNEDYYEKLSAASKMTLVHQGGPMSDAEVKSFDVHPLKEVILRMRRWDEAAKQPKLYQDVDTVSQGLKAIEDRLHTFLYERSVK